MIVFYLAYHFRSILTSSCTMVTDHAFRFCSLAVRRVNKKFFFSYLVLFHCSSYEHDTWCQNRDFSFQNHRLEYLVKFSSDLIPHERHRRRIAAGRSTCSTSPARTSTTSSTFTPSSSVYSVNDPLTVQTRVERESCSQLETLQTSVDEL